MLKCHSFFPAPTSHAPGLAGQCIPQLCWHGGPGANKLQVNATSLATGTSEIGDMTGFVDLVLRVYLEMFFNAGLGEEI